jgi:hypothetical protein
MYFLNIKALKKDLINGPLSEKQTLPYMLAWVSFEGIVQIAPNHTFNNWTIISGIISLIIAILGTYYCYNRNSGINGQYFLQRYISFGWIVGVRMALFIAIPGVILTVAIARLIGDTHAGNTWYSTIIGNTLGVFYYWRIGYHIGQVAQNGFTGDANKEE